MYKNITLYKFNINNYYNLFHTINIPLFKIKLKYKNNWQK